MMAPLKNDDFGQVVMNRRTCKEFSGSEPPRESVEWLLELAIRAPNHHLTQSCRFDICGRAGIQKWLDHLSIHLGSKELQLYLKTIERLKKVGALIYVSSVRDANPKMDKENYAACCAAIENILLGATSIGLESFWSTNRLMTLPQSLEFLKIPDTQDFVGAIWIGYGQKPDLSKRKAVSDFCHWHS